MSILAPIKVTAPSSPSTLVVPGYDAKDDHSGDNGSKEGGSDDGGDVDEQLSMVVGPCRKERDGGRRVHRCR